MINCLRIHDYPGYYSRNIIMRSLKCLMINESESKRQKVGFYVIQCVVSNTDHSELFSIMRDECFKYFNICEILYIKFTQKLSCRFNASMFFNIYEKVEYFLFFYSIIFLKVWLLNEMIVRLWKYE